MFCKNKLREILVVQTSATLTELFLLGIRVHFNKKLIYPIVQVGGIMVK